MALDAEVADHLERRLVYRDEAGRAQVVRNGRARARTVEEVVVGTLRDARAPMKDALNARIKHREPFRLFAPTVLEEASGTYFTKNCPSPSMLTACPVRPEKIVEIPTPTHVDGTGRLFNEDEPICCTPEEAAGTFVRTKMDTLAMGDLLAEKAEG